MGQSALQSVSASQASPDFDCPADLLNPLRIRYSKKGLLDAADEVLRSPATGCTRP